MIWIIGNNGMLGKELTILFDNCNISYIGTDKEIDITDIAVLQKFSNTQLQTGTDIQWIINCAAYTNVDRAEDEKELCYKVNVIGSENIAKTANELGAKLIYISTDYVFDGNNNSAYSEEDTTSPLSVYGKTKLEGEMQIMENNQKSIILRTAWLYGQHGKNFVFTMINLMRAKDEISVISDCWGSPTWTKNLAEAVFTIIMKDVPAYGIYNASGEGKANWYEFAKEIYENAYEKGIIDKRVEIIPINANEYPAKAVRPKNSLLDKTKFKNKFNFAFPDWKESLNVFFNDIKHFSF